MRGQDTRKTLRKLRRICDANGIELLVLPAGKGSHLALLFQDRASGDKIKIIIAGHKDISAGVQRGALRYLRDLATRVALAEALRRILEAVFKD